MNDVIDCRVELITKIVDGKISMNEVRKEIEKLEKEFGDEAFLPYSVKKKRKPWTKDYLKDLEEQGLSGAASKEFILHLAEVKEEVSKKRKSNLYFLAGTIAVLAAIIGVIVWLCNR